MRICLLAGLALMAAAAWWYASDSSEIASDKALANLICTTGGPCETVTTTVNIWPMLILGMVGAALVAVAIVIFRNIYRTARDSA